MSELEIAPHVLLRLCHDHTVPSKFFDVIAHDHSYLGSEKH